MAYNLLNKATISTTSGNKLLSESEIDSLRNYNIDSVGISLSYSDILHLDIDLGDRYPVTDLFIYTNMSGTSGVTVKYKEYVNDSYADLVLTTGSGYLSCLHNDYFNPHYLQCTFSGVNLNLYEISITSDLYDISFGELGMQSVLDVGEINTNFNTPIKLPVYNTSNKEREIYLHVGYNTDNTHKYIEINNTTSNGNFYKSYNTLLFYSNYKQNGVYNSDIVFDNNTLTLVDPGSTYIPDYELSSTYISPMFILDDSNESTYIDLDAYTDNNSSVTLYAKSSNTKPLDYFDMFFIGTPGKLHRYNIQGKILVSSSADIGSHHLESILIDENGYIYIIGAPIKVYNYLGQHVHTSSTTVYADHKAEWCDQTNFAWAYDKGSGKLSFLSLLNYDTSIKYTKSSPYTGTTNFISEFSVAKDQSLNVWYIDKVVDKVFCIDRYGNILIEVNTGTDREPVNIISSYNNSCWIMTKSDFNGLRLLNVDLEYNIKEFYLPVNDVSITCFDTVTNGFFFVSSTSLYKFDGEEASYIGSYFAPDAIEQLKDGRYVTLSSRYTNIFIVVDTISGDVVNNFSTYVNGTTITAPKVFEGEIKSSQKPVNTDHFWSDNDKDDWYAINPNDRRIKKARYHRFKIVLGTTDFYSRPEVYSLNYGKVLKKSVISNSSTDFYIKSTSPDYINNSDYIANLIVSWEDISE